MIYGHAWVLTDGQSVDASVCRPSVIRERRNVGRPPNNGPVAKRSAKLSPAKAIDLPWQEAIHTVLSSAKGPLTCQDIADRIFAERLRRNVGATPPQTVAAQFSVSLRNDPNSPYLRVARGLYTLKALASRGAQVDAEEIDDPERATETGALRAFGMFWRRDLVFWTGEGKLLRKQGAGASDVDFAGQIGVYLLHDRERVIYVGRATDTLYARIKAHISDRLGGRWDRFSWFGIRSVTEKGNLADDAVPWSQDVVVETMEALLIESLEPPLNRRRGDNFSAVEYLQATDPRIEAGRKAEIMRQIATTWDQRAEWLA